MITGNAGEWYSDDYISGYFAEDGHLVVCEEYGFSDEAIDKYSANVQNGEGYYDSNGKYRSYGKK